MRLESNYGEQYFKMLGKTRSIENIVVMANLALVAHQIDPWFFSSNEHLKGKTPVSVMRTPKGYDQVKNILIQMVFGISF